MEVGKPTTVSKRINIGSRKLLEKASPGQPNREERQIPMDQEWNYLLLTEVGGFAARQVLLLECRPIKAEARTQWSRGQ